MHFRESGRRIQVIRTTYDPKSKRGVQKMLFSFPRWNLELPAEARKLLTPAELQELQEWLTRRRTETEKASRGVSYRRIVDDLIAAAEHVAEAEAKELSPEYAAKVHEATAALTEALAMAGFGKEEAAGRGGVGNRVTRGRRQSASKGR